MSKTNFDDIELETPGIEAGEINSAAATDGQVLTADGAGAAAFEALPVASVTVSGIVELATLAEAQAGTDTARAVTPSGLPVRIGAGGQVFSSNASAAGSDAVAIGNGAGGSGAYGVAVGRYAFAETMHGVAIGHNVSTGGDYGIAIGYDSVSNNEGIVIGRTAGGGARGVTLGSQASGSGYASVCIGYSTNAWGVEAVAVGEGSSAGGKNSVTIGGGTASGAYAIAIGREAIGSGASGVAVGPYTSASAAGAVAVGNGATATQAAAMSFGSVQNVTANSVKIGWNNTTGFAHFTTFTPTVGVKTGTHFLPVNLGGTVFNVLVSNV